MTALADARVAEFLQERVIATYMKVGTFQKIGNRKVGGNVASYFCLPDGAVVHAVPGPSNAATFLSEATVKTHVGSIFGKLGVRDRAAAIVFAYDHGVVTPGAGST